MNADRFTLLAPAKLNLFLHITGRRSDGYHELQTLFQLLDHGDRLSFATAPPGQLSLHLRGESRPAPLPMERNLILRAARALRDTAGNPALGAEISLEKCLPAGAGLGGGSADAAITLLGLRALWDLPLSDAELAALGLSLGADVPLFVGGQSAWAEGVGERLEPVSIPPAWYLVITPDCAVSTADIFCHEQLTRNSPAIKMADFLAGRARNDCEAVTRMLFPQVDEALNWLSQHAEARMTGTGSSLFARFDTQAQATRVLDQLPHQWQGFVARGIDKLEHEFKQA